MITEKFCGRTRVSKIFCTLPTSKEFNLFVKFITFPSTDKFTRSSIDLRTVP